jgi:hypothetical protein
MDALSKKKRGTPRDRAPAILTVLMLAYYGAYIYARMFWHMGGWEPSYPFGLIGIVLIFDGLPGIILASLYLVWRWSWERRPYWTACVPVALAIVGIFIIANAPLKQTGVQIRLEINLEKYTNAAEMLLSNEIEGGNASPEYCHLADDCKYWREGDFVYFVTYMDFSKYTAIMYAPKGLQSGSYEYKLRPQWYYVTQSIGR